MTCSSHWKKQLRQKESTQEGLRLWLQVQWVPPRPRAVWPLCRRLFWKTETLCIGNKSFTVLHIWSGLSFQAAKLFCLLFTHIWDHQLYCSAWTVKSFLIVPFKQLVIYRTESVLKPSNDANHGQVFGSCKIWAAWEWGTFWMSCSRNYLKSASLADTVSKKSKDAFCCFCLQQESTACRGVVP